MIRTIAASTLRRGRGGAKGGREMEERKAEGRMERGDVKRGKSLPFLSLPCLVLLVLEHPLISGSILLLLRTEQVQTKY